MLEEARFDQEVCDLMLVTSRLFRHSQTHCRDDFTLQIEEEECMAEATYLDHHQTLDVSMRSVLVDWLMEVCSCQYSRMYRAVQFVGVPRV